MIDKLRLRHMRWGKKVIVLIPVWQENCKQTERDHLTVLDRSTILSASWSFQKGSGSIDSTV